MKQHTHLVLLAALATVPGWAQDKNLTVSTTTIAQNWQQDTNGFDKSTYTPVTEFVGLDFAQLGEAKDLSMHVYGWGLKDFSQPSTVGAKSQGNLTYGYLQYRFHQANAELKAGRFTVNQGVGNEQVDGALARTDLRGGFTLEAFGGKPVVYKNLSDNPQYDNAFQHDFMAGGRLAWRAARVGEVGVSYLLDGSKASYQYPVAMPVDYTRRQLAVDAHVAPCSYIDITGRTVFDVAGHPIPAAGTGDPSRIAEHDYRATARLAPTVALTGSFVERNFFAYFAGTTLPSLFNQNEQGMFKADGASLTWDASTNLQLVADVRRTTRELVGNSTRYGADLRYTLADKHILAGGGYHKVNGYQTAAVDFKTPGYSLSHDELRAWVMAQKDKLSASLDAIRLFYADSGTNPNLNGHATESAIVGSLGYQAKKDLKVSGDLTVEDTPLYRKQTMGLVRVEYRFGVAGNGGK